MQKVIVVIKLPSRDIRVTVHPKDKKRRIEKEQE